MLTRPDVAEKLGLSVATIRRMEGNELHPVLNARGWYEFDPEEVERVARSQGSGVPKPHRMADLEARGIVRSRIENALARWKLQAQQEYEEKIEDLEWELDRQRQTGAAERKAQRRHEATMRRQEVERARHHRHEQRGIGRRSKAEDQLMMVLNSLDKRQARYVREEDVRELYAILLND